MRIERVNSVKMLFNQATAILLVMATAMACSSRVAFADLVIDSSVFQVSAESWGYRGDGSDYDIRRFASGSNPSSTLAPTSFSDAGAPHSVGFGYVEAVVTSNSLKITATGTAGETHPDTPYYSYSDSYGFARFVFHVTQDSSFTLIDTTTSLAYNYLDFYGTRNVPNDFQQLAHVATIGIPGGIITGTLYTGYSYVFEKHISGDAYQFNGSFSGTAGGSGDATLTIHPVPEPSSLALLGLGGIGSAIATYRRRKAAIA